MSYQVKKCGKYFLLVKILLFSFSFIINEKRKEKKTCVTYENGRKLAGGRFAGGSDCGDSAADGKEIIIINFLFI